MQNGLARGVDFGTDIGLSDGDQTGVLSGLASGVYNENSLYLESIYNPLIVKNGLILYWDAAQFVSYPGSGTTWMDISGNGNNGTLNGSAPLATFDSNNGGSLVFDGTDDFVQTANNTGISGANARSLCVWVYPTQTLTNTFYTVCRFGINSNGQLFEILLQNNNVTAHFWGTVPAYTVNSRKTLLNNNSYIVLTYSGTDVSIYVDGFLRGTSSRTLDTGNSVLKAGTPEFSGHNNYKGKIYIIELYNKELTAAEILQNYNATKSRFNL